MDLKEFERQVLSGEITDFEPYFEDNDINYHLRYILAKLGIEVDRIIEMNGHGTILGFIKDKVHVDRYKYSGKQCELIATLCVFHRAETCHMSVKGLGLIIRSENNGIVDITLRNYNVCNANALEQTTDKLKCEIYDTDEYLECEY